MSGPITRHTVSLLSGMMLFFIAYVPAFAQPVGHAQEKPLPKPPPRMGLPVPPGRSFGERREGPPPQPSEDRKPVSRPPESVTVHDEPEWKAAYEHYRKGRTDEADETYAALEKTDPLAAGLFRVRIAADLNRLSTAEAKLGDLRKPFRRSPAVLGWSAEIAFRRGRLDVAEEWAAQALELSTDDLRARLIRARILTATGKIHAADEAWRYFVRAYNRLQPTSADDLLLVAEGSLEYARWHGSAQIFDFVLNTLCEDAIAADPLCWPAHALGGAILVEKFNAPQARRELAKALAINPRAVTAILLRARSAASELDEVEARKLAEQVLDIAADHPDALRLLGELELGTGNIAQALEHLEKARLQNPVDEETLGLIAAATLQREGIPTVPAMTSLLDRLVPGTSNTNSAILTSRSGNVTEPTAIPLETAFMKLTREVASRNPACGVYLKSVGEGVEQQRNQPAAEVCYKAAIRVFPQTPGVQAALGMLQLQTGQIDAAQRTLDAAFKADPFHVRVSNMREVLSLLKNYETLSTDHFVIRYDASQDELLAKTMARFLEEAVYPELTKEFGFEPETRTQFELYSRGKGQTGHQWFSARMVGVPWLQTIGASTGSIVALASPGDTSKPYNWARVVRHEYTHVLTLQQTGFRIPHWFTEALAMRSEHGVMPASWDRLILERVPKRELLDLSTLNRGFQRARNGDDWSFAYCQSALYADYFVERFGPDALKKLLRAYQDNLTTEQALKTVFQTPVDDFEKGYLDFLDRAVAARTTTVVAAPPREETQAMKDAAEALKKAQTAKVAGEAKQAELLAEEAFALDPHLSEAALMLASATIREGDLDQAIRILTDSYDPERPDRKVLLLLITLKEKQKEWPEVITLARAGRTAFPHDPAWLEALASGLKETGAVDEYRTALDELVKRDPDDLDYRHARATLAEEDHDFTAMAAAAWNLIEIDVNDMQARRLLAECAARKDPAEAERLYQQADEIDDEDLDLLVSWARFHLNHGDPAKARPLYERAKTLNAKDKRVKALGEVLDKASL